MIKFKHYESRCQVGLATAKTFSAKKHITQTIINFIQHASWFKQLSIVTNCCKVQIEVQVLSALNHVDPLHNCMFENKLCFQNVFAKTYFAMLRKAPEVGNKLCTFLQTKLKGKSLLFCCPGQLGPLPETKGNFAGRSLQCSSNQTKQTFFKTATFLESQCVTHSFCLKFNPFERIITT